MDFFFAASRNNLGISSVLIKKKDLYITNSKAREKRPGDEVESYD